MKKKLKYDKNRMNAEKERMIKVEEINEKFERAIENISQLKVL